MYGFKRYLESRVESTRKVDIGIDKEKEKKRNITNIFSWTKVERYSVLEKKYTSIEELHKFLVEISGVPCLY